MGSGFVLSVVMLLCLGKLFHKGENVVITKGILMDRLRSLVIKREELKQLTRRVDEAIRLLIIEIKKY